MVAVIKINPFDRNIKQTLAELPEKMAKHAEEVLLRQAELMRDLAKIYAPVETGALRDSIRVERGGIGKGWREVRVRAGGYVINPLTGRLVDYAVYQEKGTRYISAKMFMERAYQDVAPTIKVMLENDVAQKVTV